MKKISRSDFLLSLIRTAAAGLVLYKGISAVRYAIRHKKNCTEKSVFCSSCSIVKDCNILEKGTFKNG